MDGFVFFRLSYFDYSDLQLFAIFIFEVYFSETYLMTSAENSNFENFLGKVVEISRSYADCYNSSFAVKMASFETLTELCTARKEECPQILLH